MNPRAERLGLFLLFLAGTSLIFVFGNPYWSFLRTNQNSDYNALLAVFFLATTLLAYRKERSRRYWHVSFAFFAAAFANWVLGLDLVRFPGDAADTVVGITWDKLSQSIKVVVPLLLLVALGGFGVDSVYLQRGKVKAWVAIGLGSLIAFSVLGLVVGASQGKSWNAMLTTLPLWLIFSLLNATMEELWYRGLFLPRLAPFLGQGLSVLLIALVFGASHVGATYVTPGEILQFVVPVFLVGFGAGWLIVKTDSLWGGVLFHAGADVFYALAFTFFSAG
jgi:membrane protease YdiL (CAAX protease family)